MDAEVVIIGGGISGMATAARLQARGLATLVLEAHGQVGGCAGFFRRRGFAFDVGATTFVDFEPGGVGGQFLAEIGVAQLAGKVLPGYRLWLPDCALTLHRSHAAWHRERLRILGDTPDHRRFWQLLDQIAAVFWSASRAGIRLPIQAPGHVWQAAQLIPPRHWPLLRYLTWSLADALRASNLENDQVLRSFLVMLIQDTVHSSPEEAPLINSALGITIRSAGLLRPEGGAYGFWQTIVARYRALGGQLLVGRRVKAVRRSRAGFTVETNKGPFQAGQVVSTLPIWNTAALGPPAVEQALLPYLCRDEEALGGAIVVFLGVPEEEVAGQSLTHHQLLVDYDRPLGNGNNMFISISEPGDTLSAPPGYRAVMLSTHCELDEWTDLPPAVYGAKKEAIGRRLVEYARRIYPNLGAQAQVFEIGTPRTYQKYTHRYRGAVGGIRLTMKNSNQHAVPYDLGVPGFWQAGDTTWPGLGTVACVLGSRHVADAICSPLSAAARCDAAPVKNGRSSFVTEGFHERTI